MTLLCMSFANRLDRPPGTLSASHSSTVMLSSAIPASVWLSKVCGYGADFSAFFIAAQTCPQSSFAAAYG
jgi:hypothetical protein